MTPDAETRLDKELTDILITAEGYGSASPIAQHVAGSSLIATLRSMQGRTRNDNPVSVGADRST